MLPSLPVDQLAPRAAHYDAAGVHPLENWHDLGAEGFLAVTIPREHGGLGLDMPTYIGAIETMAQGCANTAMTVHMHSRGRRRWASQQPCFRPARQYVS